MRQEPKSKIVIDNKCYGLVSKYAIPRYLSSDYCTKDFTLYDNGEVRNVSATKHCFFCSRRFTEATRPIPLLCTSKEINRQLGYVGRMCCDCLYWMQKQEGYDAVPRSVKEFLDTGWYPPNAYKYMSL